MSDQKPEAFPQSAEAVVAALTELFRHQGNRSVCEVLENAKARIEETGYDNWNGGTDIFTLFLDLPLRVFAPIEPEIDRLEKAIGGKLSSVVRNTRNKWLNQVAISPILDTPSHNTKVAPSEVEHLWEPGTLRLFLSHVSAHKVNVANLKREFRTYGISCFVAHEDIEPTLEWQHQIELALRSMHALMALLTPDFHRSNWTDQEIGYALGRGVLVIPVRLGLDPYGFIGKVQGAPGSFDNPEKIAWNTVDMLLKNKSTELHMKEALVVGLEKCCNFRAAKAVVSKLEAVPQLTVDQVKRIEATCGANNQVSESFGVPERIARIVERFKPANVEESPF
ncbi:MAG TPA: toll/interleukin-1 receptor domain-containing protein [Methylomirabilota bacterium]|nr:toll/interleukin-1 receptor domain-containing protein [Methylomirabilota bacterium]